MYCLPSQVRAQHGFKAGYVVPLRGDTLRGEVQPRSELRNSTQCRFRPAGSASVTEYSPTELRGYGIRGGAAYQARLLPATATEPATLLFVRLLATGKASLYRQRTAYDETRYYVSVGNDSLRQLVQTREQRVVNDQTYYADLYPFRTLLARAFQDCPSVQPLLPRLLLATGPLTHVVERYNACVGAPARRLAREKVQVGFGLAAGPGVSKVSFSQQLPMRSGSFTAGLVTAGVYFDLVTPALNRNFTLRLDVLYLPLHYTDAYIAQGVSTVETRQRADFRLNYLQLPLQLRYRFPTGRVQPFILAGVHANFLLSHELSLQSEYTSASNTIVASDLSNSIRERLLRSDFGVLAGVGVATPGLAGHAIGLEVRVERGMGFQVDTSPVTHLQALLSVALTKQ